LGNELDVARVQRPDGEQAHMEPDLAIEDPRRLYANSLGLG
jgi:hypothetical protein